MKRGWKDEREKERRGRGRRRREEEKRRGDHEWARRRCREREKRRRVFLDGFGWFWAGFEGLEYEMRVLDDYMLFGD